MSRPYRPSNGAEGMDFMDRWCDRCEKKQGCPILDVAFFTTSAPQQWLSDDVIGTNARCTAFEPSDAAMGARR